MKYKLPDVATPAHQKKQVRSIAHETTLDFAHGVANLKKHRFMPFGMKPRY